MCVKSRSVSYSTGNVLSLKRPTSEVFTVKSVQYRVSIKGLPTPKGAISFSALGRIIEVLSQGSERALRLALEGGSKKKGPTPLWLARSADFVLTDIRPGSTTLVFEAPTLGAVAGRQIKQQDLWAVVPEPEDTALTVLSKSVRDAENENLDSESYDLGVLESLLGFRRILDEDNVTIRISSLKRKTDSFKLDVKSFKKIEMLRTVTPESQAVLLTGFLDLIVHSKHRFEFTLENGQTVRGKIDETLIPVENMRQFWGKKVTIKGTLHFAASKKPRFLEAQVINPRSSSDDVLSSISYPLPIKDIIARVHRESNEVSVSEIWGKWPGDESIDELMRALTEPKAEG